MSELITCPHCYKMHERDDWVSVEDELPEDATWCNAIFLKLVDGKRKAIVTMLFFEGMYPDDKTLPCWLDNIGNEDEEDYYENVTHWQPLPELPEQQ